MSDVLSVASKIVKICLEVQKITNAAKHNKDKCRAIGVLVGRLKVVLEDIKDIPHEVLERPLGGVEDAVEETLDFLKKQYEMGKVARFVRARAVKEGFSDLEKNLNTQIQILQVAQGAAAAKGQEKLAEGQTDILQGQQKLVAEVSARLKSIREKMLAPPTETVHDMVMNLVNQPELPETMVGLKDRVQEVWKMVEEMEGNILGVAGMGGVGKTTLMLAVYTHAKKDGQFDTTCWVTVSQTPDLMQCQRQIWTQVVGSMPPAFSTAEQGYRLLLRELAGRKVFAVLDDIWRFGDLELLQVVRGSGKIVFTTRKSDIARRAQANVYEHTILDDCQSQILFNLKAFGAATVPEDRQDFQPYAQQMAAECEGLPLALTVIGSLAAGYGLLQEWRAGCRKLKNAKVLDDEHEQKVLHILRSSFDELDSDEQAFFLFLVALPEDYHMIVSDLVEQWVALNQHEASDDDEEHFESQQDKAYIVFGRLLDRHLVLPDNSGFPRFQRDEKDALMAVTGFRESGLSTTSCYLHDTIREMGLQAAREGERSLLFLDSFKLLQPAIAKARGVSVCHASQISAWPEGAKAPQMEWLVLREMGLTAIPSTIFSSVKLTILDMSFSRLASVPTEIAQLQGLRLLRLDGCVQLKTLAANIICLQCLMVLSLRLCESLEELPNGIGQLKQLNILHCPGCGLETLPQSIGELENLKQLDLSFCTRLKELPSSLGGATQLEHLSVAGCSMLKSLPNSIHQLFELVTLNAAGCHGLIELPASWPRKLQLLDLQGCECLIAIPPGICDLSHLKALFLQGCTKLEQFPYSGLPHLQAVGLPLFTYNELVDMYEKHHITFGEVVKVLEGGLHVRSQKLYLLHGELDCDWLKAVQEKMTWLPQGAHYQYIAMKKLGRETMDMKAALEGTVVEDEAGQTSLHHAARDGDVAALQHTLAAEVSVDGKDKCGLTALMLAAQKGHIAIVEELMEHCARVDVEDKRGWTALIHGARNGHLPIVSVLVSCNANIGHADHKDGWTALIHAAAMGHPPIVSELVSFGADVEHEDQDGRTALMWAANNNCISVIEELIAVGVDVQHADKEGNTALMKAAQSGHDTIVEKLLDSGADVSHENKDGQNVLLRAAQGGSPEVVEKLLSLGMDVHHADKEANTALLAAARWRQGAAVEKLLAAGADVTHKNKDGKTALQLNDESDWSWCQSVAHVLLRHGANE